MAYVSNIIKMVQNIKNVLIYKVTNTGYRQYGSVEELDLYNYTMIME